MTDLRVATAAVASMAEQLGAAFHPTAVAELAEQLCELHREQTARVREQARALGTDAEDQLDRLGWMLVIRDTARFIAVGKGDIREQT